MKKIIETLKNIGVGLLFLLFCLIILALIFGLIYVIVTFPVIGIVVMSIIVLFFANWIGKDFRRI